MMSTKAIINKILHIQVDKFVFTHDPAPRRIIEESIKRKLVSFDQRMVENKLVASQREKCCRSIIKVVKP